MLIGAYNPMVWMVCNPIALLFCCFVVFGVVQVSKCPDLVLEFKAGFERENALRAFDTHYPF